VVAHRVRQTPAPTPAWNDGKRYRLDDELASNLLGIAWRDDDGSPKTGRRYYYLALSHGYIEVDMSDTSSGKKSRDRAYKKITAKLGSLRMASYLGWDMVLDLTRELDEWQTYGSPCEARTAIRRNYNEDAGLGRRCFRF
jgi:hypothetical protein